MRSYLGSMLVAFVTTATTALADPQPTPEPKLPHTSEGRSYGSFSADLPGEPQGLLDTPRIGMHFLTDFSFKFDQGDRRLRKLALGFDFGVVLGQFMPYVDVNHPSRNNPYRWRVRTDFHDTLPIDTDVRGSCRKFDDCQGECAVTIGARPAGHHFVLTGFQFLRDGEANVRRISVLPNPAQKTVRVRFADNGSPRFEGEICYAYVADRWFQGSMQTARFEYQPGEPVPRKLIGRHRLALAGFDFEFENGDHHVRELAITYERPYLSARFCDQNTDDPWRAIVHYELLKP
jgi:hypothetical protein